MLLKIILFVAMFVLASTFMIGAQLGGEIAQEFGLSGQAAKALGGNLVTAFTTSSFIVIALVTLFGRRINRKIGCGIALIIQGIGFLSAMSWPDGTTLWIPFTLIGCGFHSLFAFLTAMVLAAFEGSNTAVVLNRYYVGFGLGFTLPPFFLTSLVQGGITCRNIFLTCAAVVILFGLYILVSPVRTAQAGAVKRAVPLIGLVGNWRFYLYGLAILVYVGVEVSISVWTKGYLIDINRLNISDEQALAVMAGRMVTAFWIGMLLGRSFIGNVSKRFGLMPTFVVMSLASAGVMYLATQAAAGQAPVTIGFLMLGLAMSGLYAFIFSMATDRFKDYPEDVVSALVLFTSLGVIVLPTYIVLVGIEGMNLLPLALVALVAIILPVLIGGSRAVKPAEEV